MVTLWNVCSQQMFAEKLCHLVKGISESVPIKTLSFVSDACQLLVQCHKVAVHCNIFWSNI